MAVFGAAGLLWLLWHARDMNLLSLGDEAARDWGWTLTACAARSLSRPR